MNRPKRLNAFGRRAFHLARASEEAGDGLQAFVEKRAPDFEGR
jgi:1,4-dihydroxy-2-naphthoyl-CoA synthase